MEINEEALRSGMCCISMDPVFPASYIKLMKPHGTLGPGRSLWVRDNDALTPKLCLTPGSSPDEGITAVIVAIVFTSIYIYIYKCVRNTGVYDSRDHLKVSGRHLVTGNNFHLTNGWGIYIHCYRFSYGISTLLKLSKKPILKSFEINFPSLKRWPKVDTSCKQLKKKTNKNRQHRQNIYYLSLSYIYICREKEREKERERERESGGNGRF